MDGQMEGRTQEYKIYKLIFRNLKVTYVVNKLNIRYNYTLMFSIN